MRSLSFFVWERETKFLHIYIYIYERGEEERDAEGGEGISKEEIWPRPENNDDII